MVIQNQTLFVDITKSCTISQWIILIQIGKTEERHLNNQLSNSPTNKFFEDMRKALKRDKKKVSMIPTAPITPDQLEW